MKKNKLSKDSKICIFTICLIVFSYGAERVVELFAPLGKNLGIILAMIFTLLLAATFFILSKIKDAYMGMLASIVACKMMPVNISFLYDYSKKAYILYFIVKTAGFLMFLVLIYKFFTSQSKDKKVSALTVLTILASVPFFTDAAKKLTEYFLDITGSMMGGYISQFILYAIAVLLILFISFNSGVVSLEFAFSFEAVALAVNVLKAGAKIGYRAINGAHISRSYFVWIALYLGLLLCFTAALKLKRGVDAQKKSKK